MKTDVTIRSLLGTTQSEMAILLNVSMGQYSMFESGKRKLPTNAMLLLGEMLSYMQKPEAHTGKNLKEVGAKQEGEVQQQLKILLKENEFQLEKTNRKISEALKKYEGNLKALQLANFLDSRAKNQKTDPPKILKSIEARAIKDLGKNSLTQVTLLQAKGQFLRVEQEWIKDRLGVKTP